MKLLSKRQSFVLAALTVLIGSGFAYMYITVDPPGHCAAKQKYISDEEFIRASVALLEWEMSRAVVYPDGTKKKRKDVLNVYKKMDFDPTKPNCCWVDRGHTHSIFRRILGWQEVLVRLNPKTSKGPVQYMGDSFIPLQYDVCGKLLDGLGLPETGHEEITTANYLEITNE